MQPSKNLSRANTETERIADLAKKIAEQVIFLTGEAVRHAPVTAAY